VTKRRSEQGSDSPDWLERVASWMSAAVLAAFVVFLVWDGLRTDLPAAFRVRVGEPALIGAQLHVPVTVDNVGDRAARAVEVSVSSGDSGSAAEGAFTIDWIPGRSSRRGVAVLPAGPSNSRVSAEVRGYVDP
jgi:uncharacterized protein (TIGR02588 family)